MNKELPKRKQLRLNCYDYSSNGAYFVTICTHNRCNIFLKSIKNNVGSPLPKIVDLFKTMVTNEYIKGVKEALYTPFNKKLWQRGYFEHIIRNEKDLFETRKYIEENPMKWELDEYY